MSPFEYLTTTRLLKKMDSSLNVIEVSRVAPSNADSSESLTLPFTFFDLLFINVAVQQVIFYKLTDATRPFFDSVIVPNLKSSLSSFLSHYHPLAGKIIWDSLDQKPSIVYVPNDAVSSTAAESNADFSLLTGKKPFPASELYPLVPELPNSDDSATVVSFQVTLFPNQGFCIGVSAHHAVLDGKTITMFLKAWAHTCKQLHEQTGNTSLPQDLIPIFDRTVIKGPQGIEMDILNAWQYLLKIFAGGKEPENPRSLKLFPSPAISPDIFQYTLELTREDLNSLGERLKRESQSSSSPKELRLSAFVVTYSYAITCLIRARGGDPDRPVGFGFMVDCRRFMDPPVPSNYFGNCISGSFKKPLTAETFMGKEGFFTAARHVSDLLEELDGSVAFKIPEIIKGFTTLPPGAQDLSLAWSNRSGIYGLDFGWGRPERVGFVSIVEGQAISVAESRDGNGGLEFGFSLKKHEMDLLVDLLHEGLKK